MRQTLDRQRRDPSAINRHPDHHYLLLGKRSGRIDLMGNIQLSSRLHHTAGDGLQYPGGGLSWREMDKVKGGHNNLAAIIFGG